MIQRFAAAKFACGRRGPRRFAAAILARRAERSFFPPQANFRLELCGTPSTASAPGPAAERYHRTPHDSRSTLRVLVPRALTLATCLAAHPARGDRRHRRRDRAPERWRLSEGLVSSRRAGRDRARVRDDRFAALDAATWKQLWITGFAPAPTQKPQSEPTRSPSCARRALALVLPRRTAACLEQSAAAGNSVLADSDDGTLATLDRARAHGFDLRNGDSRSKSTSAGSRTGAVAKMILARRRHLLRELSGYLLFVRRDRVGKVHAIGDVIRAIGPCPPGGRHPECPQGRLAPPRIDLAKATEVWPDRRASRRLVARGRERLAWICEIRR